MARITEAPHRRSFPVDALQDPEQLEKGKGLGFAAQDTAKAGKGRGHLPSAQGCPCPLHPSPCTGPTRLSTPVCRSRRRGGKVLLHTRFFHPARGGHCRTSRFLCRLVARRVVKLFMDV